MLPPPPRPPDLSLLAQHLSFPRTIMNKIVLALALLAGSCSASHNDWRAKHVALESRMSALDNQVSPSSLP